MQYAFVDTSWGAFCFVARDGRLIRTFLPEPKKIILSDIRKRWPGAEENRRLLPMFQKQVARYFSGKPCTFSVSVDVADQTTFRQVVLDACRKIPYGHTASYADLARAVGKPGAARAVGGTMARNPLPLIVPCHRVVRSDGSLGGFSSRNGLDEKKRLLRLEDALPESGLGRRCA